VILVQAPGAIVPGVGALDDPTLREDLEAAGGDLEERRLLVNPGADVAVARMAHDLHVDAVLDGNLAGARSGVAGVDEHHPDAGRLRHRQIHDAHRRIPVLHARHANRHRHQQAQRVGDEVPLATLDLLAGVVPLRATLRGGLHRLRVQDRRGRFGVAALMAAPHGAQLVVQLLEEALRQPPPEGAVHQNPRRHVLRQHPPRATRTKHVHAGVQHLPPRVARWSPRLARRIEQVPHRLPLRVRQARRVPQRIPLIAMRRLVPVPLRPLRRRRAPHQRRRPHRPLLASARWQHPHEARLPQVLADRLRRDRHPRRATERVHHILQRQRRTLTHHPQQDLHLLRRQLPRPTTTPTHPTRTTRIRSHAKAYHENSYFVHTLLILTE